MPARKRNSEGPSDDAPIASDPFSLLQKLGDPNDFYARATARKAREGDTEAAREILKDFVFAIDERNERMWPRIGPPVHWDYARYLADAFTRILDGVDAAVALGVKNSSPGRRRGAGNTHDLKGLAAALNLLCLNGMTPKQAKLSLKEKTGAAIRTLEKANKEHNTYRWFLEQLQAPGTSEQNRDLGAEIMKNGAQRYAAVIAEILVAQKAR